MIDWTERYRPRSLTDIAGNTKQLHQLVYWAEEWKNSIPKKKAVILSGKPGIGKTTAAYVLARKYDWTPIELNTSDARNASKIKSIATAGATHQTFQEDGSFSSTESGGHKLIILDEADNLYERKQGSIVNDNDLSDKGGKTAIINTVKVTKHPLILICNDYYQLTKGSGAILRKLCLHLSFYQPYPPQIKTVLKRICQQEHITIDDSVLQYLSEQCKGDIRSAVHDLQSITLDKTTVTKEDIKNLGSRDQSEVIFDVLKEIFQNKDIQLLQHMKRNIQEDPQLLLLWIAENLPRSYTSSRDLMNGFEAVSYADLYLGRVHHRNNYRFWGYASDFMIYGVSLAKSHRAASMRYQFPTWLKSLKKRKINQKTQQELSEDFSKYTHCSRKKVSQEIYPFLQNIIKNQPEILTKIKQHNTQSIRNDGFFPSKQTTSSTQKKEQSSKKEQKKKEDSLKKPKTPKKQQQRLFL